MIKHPPNHHSNRWYVYHAHSWVVYGIVLTTLVGISWVTSTVRIVEIRNYSNLAVQIPCWRPWSWYPLQDGWGQCQGEEKWENGGFLGVTSKSSILIYIYMLFPDFPWNKFINHPAIGVPPFTKSPHVTNNLLSHRIHGAGIYANIKGVYWW